MLVTEIPVHHTSPVKADVQDKETLSLQEGEDVLVPEVPVHHASPVKADVQDEETSRYYYVFLHEPLGQEQIKYVFLYEPLGQEQNNLFVPVPFCVLRIYIAPVPFYIMKPFISPFPLVGYRDKLRPFPFVGNRVKFSSSTPRLLPLRRCSNLSCPSTRWP